jgi:hypothetical protein
MATLTIPKDKSKLLNEPSEKSDSVSVVYASDLFKTCIDNGMYCLKIKFLSLIIELLN